MKAAVLADPGGLENLRIVDVADPGAPGPNELRVRVHATSLNYHDLAVVTNPSSRNRPHIPMSDGAGVVDAVGPGVEGFKVGDHVVSTFFPTWLTGGPTIGGFASVPGDGIDGFACEYVVASVHAFTPAPNTLSFAESGTITTAGLTAWRALIDNGQLKPGDSVLTLGTGGVSIWALQIAVAMGAQVIVTSSSDAKLERARALGATHTVNYTEHPDWALPVLELTEGRGVDHVIDIGGNGTMTRSIRSARVGGHVALIGVLAAEPAEIRPAVSRQVRIQGLLVGSNQQQREFVKGIDSLRIRPVVDRSYPLEEIVSAFEFQRNGSHFGKVVLEY